VDQASLKTRQELPSASQRGEAHILSLLLRRPELLYRIDRGLLEASLERLSPEDFGYTDHQLLFELVRKCLEQDADEACDYLQHNLPPSLKNLAEELSAKPDEPDPSDDRVLEDLFRAVIKIRRAALIENINQLRFFQEEAQQGGDLRSESYRDMVQQCLTACAA
jgi:hypothetical protein